LLLAVAARLDADEALFAAARSGDVAAVRARLDSGASPNAANRHGTTVLMMAADRGHADVVRLLVERGADVNARDRFFGSSPLELALSGRHTELALWLLARGATDVDALLEAAVERKDARLARAALASGRVEPLELEAARRSLAADAPEELKQTLAAARAARPARAPQAVSPERLNQLAGRYASRGDGPPVEATVSVDGSNVVVRIAGQPDLVARPVGEDRFESAAGDATLRFGGRGGLVEWARLNRAGDVVFLGTASGPPPAALATTAAAPLGPASRGAPRPWPSFRGPGGSGDGQGAPTAWDVAAGRNVRFRTPIPGLGLSSPVVWGERIFVTTAVSAKDDRTFRTGLYGDGTSVDDVSEHSFRLYALDAASGRVVWEREVVKSPPGAKRHLKSSQANSTPATDGRRVVALFGSVGVLAAYDVDGRPLWRRDLGVLDCGDEVFGNTEWGHASSPVLLGETVVVQADHKGGSFVAAYRLADGAILWRTPREEASTWSTPAVLPSASGDEIVANGRTIRGYAADSGKLLWTLAPNSQNIVSSPVVGDGLAFVTGGYPPVRPIYAIRPGQRGDLSLPPGQTSNAAVAWSHARGGSYIPTPLLYDGHLYTLNNNGVLACHKATTGEQLYQARIGTGSSAFSASPVAADGRIYVASENGEVYVLRAGPEQAQLARNDMGEAVMATPAISNGLLVIRTLAHVVGLEEQPSSSRRHPERSAVQPSDREGSDAPSAVASPRA
jgi:outer membrane protein assembly factor BamB